MCNCNKITICTEFDPVQIAGLQVPIASIHAFATQTVPDGYLICDGSEVSRTDYADLYAALGAVWGEGDGTTTFNIPDLRGEFLRGFDDSRGVDEGREFGTAQGFTIENITGRFGGSSLRSSFEIFEGAFARNSEGLTSNAASSDGSSSFGVDFDASRVVSTSNETRPRNVAVTYAIKATNPASA